MKEINYGSSLIDRGLFQSLERLWMGPLEPQDLDDIEYILRAFLLGEKLVPSQDSIAIQPYSEGKKIKYFEYENPFNDHLLDYEFVKPEEEFFVRNLPSVQQSVLVEKARLYSQSISQKIISDELNSGDLRWGGITNAGENINYNEQEWLNSFNMNNSRHSKPSSYLTDKAINDLIMGHSELRQNLMAYEESYHAQDLGYFLDSVNSVLYREIDYYVSCHREGMSVFSNSLAGNICEEFVFSEWPHKIFKDIEPKYYEMTRSLRGPGFGIELPPLILIILSIANNRQDIPRTIVQLRDEYAESREKLWLTLSSMWNATTLKEQTEILNSLTFSTNNIINGINSNGINCLSIGLDLAQMSVGGVVAAGQKLLDHGSTQAKISAIAFTNQLGSDLKNNALNIKHVINKHLSKSERDRFGY